MNLPTIAATLNRDDAIAPISLSVIARQAAIAALIPNWTAATADGKAAHELTGDINQVIASLEEFKERLHAQLAPTPSPKYLRTRFVVDVLSERPFDGVPNLETIAYEIDQGECIGQVQCVSSCHLTGPAMANACYAFGSTPDFFQLDDQGSRLLDD